MKRVNDRRYALPGTFESLIWVILLCFFCLLFKWGVIGIPLIIGYYIYWVNEQHEEYERRRKWRVRKDYLDCHPKIKREIEDSNGLNFYYKFDGYWYFELMSMGYSYEEAIQMEHDMIERNTQDFYNPA